MSFFKRWGKGIKGYAASQEGYFLSKLVFMFPVVIGLFAAGIERFLADNFWLGVVLVGFGCLQAIEFRLLFRGYLRLLKQNKILKVE